MDAIDQALQAAWRGLADDLRHQRLADLAQRLDRRRLAQLTRPPRAWCLCLRASDRRLDALDVIIDPPEAVHARQPHVLHIKGTAIRELCRPVRIPYPGIDHTIAARLVGRHPESLRSWIRHGSLRARYDAAWSIGKCGKPVPIVWAPTPLDPNANYGLPPDPVWGSLWETLYEHIPPEYELVIRREPRFRFDRGTYRFCGWSFVCPGRVDENGDYKGCGRRCQRIYGPQSVWTLAHQQPLPAAAQRSLGDVDLTEDPIRSTGPRSFACAKCWNVRFFSLMTRDAWNQFIGHLSGGLLYGHEVPRPPDEAPRRRKRRYVRLAGRPPSARRSQVLAGLLEGLTYQQIADRLGIAYATVHSHVKKIYKEHGVHGRSELRRQLMRQGSVRP
jgi:DNA-binding CsgD family transcriptional regulator